MRNIIFSTKVQEAFVVLCLLVALLIQAWCSIERINLTSDEGTHLASGYSYWKTQDFRLNREHPPLVKLIASLPLLFKDISTEQSWSHLFTADPWNSGTVNQWNFAESLLLQENRQQLESNLRLARRAVTIFVLGMAVCIYFFSRELFGVAGGMISLTATVFNPDILAHACLITTDMAMATFYFAVPAGFWCYLQRPSGGKLMGVGILLGLGLASKYSNLALLPVLGVLAMLAWVYKPELREFPAAWYNLYVGRTLGSRIRHVFAASMAILAMVALVLWVLYFFNEPFSQYWSGYQQVNKNHNPNFSGFLLGEYSTQRFWNYFLVTSALKTPLSVVLLLALAFGAYWRYWRTMLSSIKKTILFFPPLFLLVLMSWKAANIGHRYVLGMYPYIFVMIGMSGYWLCGIGQQLFRYGSVFSTFTMLCMVAVVYTGLRSYPFHLSYHNEIVPSDMEFIEYLDDSNNDWSQGWKELAKVQKEEHLPPMFAYPYNGSESGFGGVQGGWIIKHLSTELPAPGIHALSANSYRRNLDWFRAHGLVQPLLHTYKPNRMIAGCIVLIEVPFPSLVEKHPLTAQISLHSNGKFDRLSHYYLDEQGNKVKSGLFQIWDADGNLMQSAFYLNGKLTGPYTLWSGGKLLESGYMWNGKIHGDVNRWEISGKKINTITYLEGIIASYQ